MYVPKTLAVRDGSDSGGLVRGSVTTGLLTALLVIVIVGIFAVAGLIFLRRHRRAKAVQVESDLPTYTKKHSRTWNKRGLIVTASLFKHNTQPVTGNQEKELMLESGPSSPTSPLPEIHITFPEEVDECGRKTSGRVVVVRVGDNGVGLEPLHDEDLPPYQKAENGRFQSVDLDRIGGLREKGVEESYA